MLQGKEVEVTYQGMRYRGRLVETTDLEINLKTPMDWVVLPLEGVSSVRQILPEGR